MVSGCFACFCDQEWYYHNGQLKTKKIYKDGKLDGESLSYHENGQLKTRANFRDGKRKGILEEFYEDGSVKNDN